MEPIDLSTDNVRRRGLRLPPGIGRRGTYLLTFRDGWQYLGRTDDVIVRMGGHFRTYDDIVGISFHPTSAGDLDREYVELERYIGRTNGGRAASPSASRSTSNDVAIGDSRLARIEWIEKHLSRCEDDRPPEVPGQRERTRPRFDRLAAHPDFELLRESVHRYLERVIPAPEATERQNWVITSMPSTAKTSVWHRLVCLSVNNVEALTIGEQFDGERWTVAGFMSAAPSFFSTRSILPVSALRMGAFLAPAFYKTVGDVWQIGFDSLAALGPLLDSDPVLDHVGALMMRLMRRGRGMYGRFHDYNLADAILE